MTVRFKTSGDCPNEASLAYGCYIPSAYSATCGSPRLVIYTCPACAERLASEHAPKATLYRVPVTVSRPCGQLTVFADDDTDTGNTDANGPSAESPMDVLPHGFRRKGTVWQSGYE
ncbi:hypothetical protein GCM10027570_40020 [Streptomonospora sediminis]